MHASKAKLFPLLIILALTGCPPGVVIVPGGGGGSDGDVLLTGIRVTTPIGSEAVSYDVYSTATGLLVEQAKSSDEDEEIPPGNYFITEYFNEEFVWAQGVVVVPGGVTIVPLGAIRVETPVGANTETYDIYDATGQMRLAQPNDSDVIRPVPPGTYVLTEYFNEDFVYATGVEVLPGAVTTVPLGGIMVTVPTGASTETYDIYDATGQMRLSQPNDSGEVRPVPPGTYVLTEYFNEDFVYATGVDVLPDEVAPVILGAILYQGSESIYDIYDASGTTVLSRPNDRALVRPVPAGTYVLKPYFEDEILVPSVVVSAGATTTVP